MQKEVKFMISAVVIIVLYSIVIGVAIVALITLQMRNICSLEKEPVFREPSETSLSFFSAPCIESDADPYSKEDLGIQEINWLNDTSVEIKTRVNINCGEDIEEGYHEIDGNNVKLMYATSGCNPCAECLCVSELNYKIDGLEKGEYNFELVE